MINVKKKNTQRFLDEFLKSKGRTLDGQERNKIMDELEKISLNKFLNQEEKNKQGIDLIEFYLEIHNKFENVKSGFNDQNHISVIENFENDIKLKIYNSIFNFSDLIPTENEIKNIINEYIKNDEKISNILLEIQNQNKAKENEEIENTSEEIEKKESLNDDSIKKLKIEIQNSKFENDEELKEKINKIFPCYFAIQEIIKFIYQKTHESGLKISVKQKNQIEKEILILLRDDDFNFHDKDIEINNIIKKNIPDFQEIQSQNIIQKKQARRSKIYGKASYALQASCSLFFIQETIYQTARIIRGDKEFSYSDLFQILVYFNLGITNGIRALHGLLGENIDFAYFNNYIPAKLANFFTIKGEESSSIFNILKYFSILLTAQAFAGELCYGVISGHINSIFDPLQQNITMNNNFTITNNLSYYPQPHILIQKYFMESLNYAWYLMIDVNICVFANSLIAPYLNKKLFSHEFPFLEFDMEYNGKIVLIKNENYTKHYPEIDDKKYILLNLLNNNHINIFNECIQPLKRGEFKPFSPDLKSRNFNAKSIILRHLLFLFSALGIPSIEHFMFENSSSSLAHSFAGSFGEVFNVYGAGLATVSDFYTKMLTNTNLHENSNKANSIKKILYRFGLIQSASIFFFGINKFFFDSEIFILSDHLAKNNISKRSIANFVTAAGVFFENIHFGFFIKNLSNFKKSILGNQNNQEININLNNINKQINELEEIKKTNDKFVYFTISCNALNILFELYKIYYFVNLNNIKDYDSNRSFQALVLGKNLFMGLIIANFHFNYGSKAKIIDEQLENLYTIQENGNDQLMKKISKGLKEIIITNLDSKQR